MKTRIGFVSNSSSTSFVVAVGNGEKPFVTLPLTVNLNSYTKQYITNEAELEDAIKNGELSISSGFAAVEQIRAGKQILIGSFSDEEGVEEACLCYSGLRKCKLSPSMVIIHDEEGY